MLSNHFPFVYGHDDAWLALCAFVALGAYVRHFFNLRHRGRNAWSIPVISALAVIGLALWLQPPDEKAAPPAGAGASGGGQQVFLTAGCASCHTLADAGATGKVGPEPGCREAVARARDQPRHARSGRHAGVREHALAASRSSRSPTTCRRAPGS